MCTNILILTVTLILEVLKSKVICEKSMSSEFFFESNTFATHLSQPA